MGITFLVALGVYAALASSSMPGVGLVALILLASAALSLAVGLLAYRLYWLRRPPRVLWTILAGYVFVGVITLLGVLATALMMFISADDVRFVAVLLLFGVGIAVSFGYLLSVGLSREATRLVSAADQVALGRFDVRVEPRGRDEMAELALAFNEMTQALADAADRQRAVEKMRLDLVAWAGHDLRTPLTSVTVIVEALADGVVTDPHTAERYLETARRDLQVLSLLIDDLSLLAQIDAGGLHLAQGTGFLSSLVTEVADSFALPARQKNVHLAKEIDRETEPSSFDPLQMRRALTNLLDNAVRHTPEGGTIRVGARFTADGAVLEIWNDGPPIDQDDLPHLFERFYRSDKSRGRATGKAGLGLAIAKAIIEAHGGTITVQSDQEQGTSFILTLPNPD